MATLIKKRLEELCLSDQSLRTLWAQWTFDEQLISKALNSVSQIFPHYSLHDSSHSNQIVTNIERILGEDNIKLLSATDLWLILESAFYHDIGMVIPMETIRDDWENIDFKNHLEIISNNPSHELHTIASEFRGSNLTEIFQTSQWPLDVFENIRLLLADFYRSKHADRSGKIVKNPWQEIHLSSPRNELLPARLFKILSTISSHHGYSFEEVLRLPKKEVGIGNDDAHPRYVACLLRLGDLLDLDDNRFCPVMLKTAGALPASTHSHIEKHMSIEHFRMDQNRIEVHALCQSYEGYSATMGWFKYLEQEINNQMMHWDDIVPSKEMGLLPTIGSLDVQLNGFELLGQNQTPNFQIDKDKMLDLLQGSGVYDKPSQCIREVLQNAVDATLLKLWIDKDILGKYKSTDFSTPSNEIKNILDSDYKIEISIEEMSCVDDHIKWNISIKDHGIGIDKDSLSYLQTVGSSSKNFQKKALINTMPTWLKPSGAFGIGFQSIFLITDQVKLRSKGMYSGEVIEVEMNNPSKEHSGNIFIKSIPDSYKFDIGTIIQFQIESLRIPSSFSYSFDDKNTCYEINNYDFIEEKQLNVEILQLIHEVEKFGRNNYIPISVNFSGSNFNVNTLDFNSDGCFDIEGFRINLRKDSSGKAFTDNRYHSEILFKGQPLETSFMTPFAFFNIDLLGFQANEILEINRNKIKSSVKMDVERSIAEAIIKYLKINRDRFDEDDKQFIDSIIINLNYDYFNGDFKDHNILPNLRINTYTIKDLLEYDSIILKERNYINSEVRLGHIHHKIEIYHEPEKSITISYDKNHDSTVLSFFKRFIIPNHFKGVKISRYDNKGGEYIENIMEYDKYNCFFDINKELLKLILSFEHRERWPRMVFFCQNEFLDLAVNIEKIGFSERLWFFISYEIIFPKLPVMVLPFKAGDNSFTPYNLDRLIEWVYENRANNEVTKEQISESYHRYIEYIQNIINE
ncbi:HD domain-containing protein [Photobacterium leiognathi]|uniref:HD domain-containing protein n=1 Tax=Photobacterium leiognathi TaxID=553611 RepID=UPI0029826AA8|nr:hypothetical protein [Photobacterium leiognathi]